MVSCFIATYIDFATRVPNELNLSWMNKVGNRSAIQVTGK